MKIKSLLLIFLISAFSVLSCSNESVKPDKEIPNNVLIPLSDTYKVLKKRTVYVNGSVDTTFNVESGVKMSIMFEGQRWYGYSDDASIFYTNKSDGFHILHRPLEKQSVLYKYPAMNGDSYSTFTFQGGRRDADAFDEDNITNFDMIVMDTNATITLPSTGKTYTGLVHIRKPTVTVSTKGSIAPADWYFKPGVGSVFFQAYTDDTLDILQLEEEFIEVISD